MVTLISQAPNGVTKKPPPRNTTLAHREDQRTDLERWRLLDERGRQTWHYMSSDKQATEWPQTLADRHHLGLPLVRTLCTFIPLNLSVDSSRTCQTFLQQQLQWRLRLTH